MTGRTDKRGEEARRRLLTERLPALAWSVDRDLKIRSFEGQALPAALARTRRFVGKRLDQVLEDLDAIAAHHRALAGAPQTIELEWKGRSYQVFLEPHRGPGGRTTGISAVALDVTRHRLIEAELRNSDAVSHDLIDTLPQNIFRKDLEGKVTFANRAYCATLGKPYAELLGKTDFDLFPRELADKYVKDDRRVMATGQTLDVEEEHNPPGKERFFVRVVKTPIRDAQGAVVGVQGIFWDVTEQKLAKEQLTRRAYYDLLTDLPNRVLFLDRLRQALKRGRRQAGTSFAVLFLDLDGFKSVNDSLGHIVGDQLLVETGRRLESVVRPGDTVARIGGDEFTILLEETAGAEGARAVCDRIQRELARPYHLAGHDIVTSASIGIALGTPGAVNAEDLLRDADIAMYRAKEEGRGRHELFDPRMHAQAVAELELQSELRKAIDRDEFAVVYQPIVALATGRTDGLEAFLRWRHPRRGLLQPADFLPLAEETGLSLPIGAWRLGEVCRRLQTWREEPRAGALPRLCINLSSRQFFHPDLAGQLRHHLEQHRLPADAVALEVPEGVIMTDLEGAETVFAQIAALGAHVHLDHFFGGGTSSLSHLQKFSIDRLKVDRSLTARLESGGLETEIVGTIVKLAHQLDLEVMATGVETQAQHVRLQELHCDYAQGYFFAHPLEPDGVLPWLAAQHT